MCKTGPLIVLLLLLCVSGVSALEMCTDTKEIHTNCTMVTPTLTGCAAYNYSIIQTNSSAIVTEGDLELLSSDIYYFNFTEGKGDYIVLLCDGTTREVIVTDKEQGNMVLAIIILLPILLGIFFLIGAGTMGEDHNVLRMFLFMLSVILFFVSLHMGLLTVIKYYDFPELQDLMGTTTYWVGIVFGVIVTYFIIYLVYKMFTAAAADKAQRLEYG